MCVEELVFHGYCPLPCECFDTTAAAAATMGTLAPGHVFRQPRQRRGATADSPGLAAKTLTGLTTATKTTTMKATDPAPSRRPSAFGQNGYVPYPSSFSHTEPLALPPRSEGEDAWPCAPPTTTTAKGTLPLHPSYLLTPYHDDDSDSNAMCADNDNCPRPLPRRRRRQVIEFNAASSRVHRQPRRR
ncbi:hypothetical protein EDB85DRAFT_629151 [Lactarius pseudohatsudake]|nr:hypothetical protein EDB85DRAFT_629151 [Lactarius pseudohatsudake]